MDLRASRRPCRDGSVHTVQCSSSGYNGPQSSAFASHRYERTPLHWVAAADNLPERPHSAPSSRSSSPEAQSSSHHSWVPNFSRLLPSASLSTIMQNRSAGCYVKRWDPTWRTTTPWDSLKLVRFCFLSSSSFANPFDRTLSCGLNMAIVLFIFT